MSEEEKKENQQEEEEIDQEKLAEEWEKMAQQPAESAGEESSEEEEVDQEKLAQEWEQMAQQASQESTEEEVDQDKLAEEWEKMAQGESAPQQEDLASEWEKALQESQPQPQPEMESFEKEKLDLLMDIPLEISVEIGSTTMPLEEVLKLNPNSIVELDRYINQPVDIKVNGKLIAKGELYTVENNFGIKITSIITVQERMKLLTDENS
ncbi:flagellar motor switch protein FliN [Persephonella sp.]